MSKKFTLKYLAYLLFWVVTGATTVSAQNVTIGTGTNNNVYAPIYGCGTYSYSQMIFTAAEIIAANGGVSPAGTVINLRFHYSTASSNFGTSGSDSWTIWMANTTQSSFAGTAAANWVPMTAANQVFDGTVIFPQTGNWLNVPLQVPFNWNGTDNIVVAVNDNNPGTYDCDIAWDATTTSPTYETMYYNNFYGSNVDITALPSASARSYTRPNVQLQWAVACNLGTGYPTTGTVAVTPNNLCLSGNVSMSFTPATAMPSVTGITYKWQSCPTATGTFVDIPGSTSANPFYTTTTPISSVTYFKCVVMCGTTALFSSAASSAVTITNPGTVSGTGAARCGPGSVNLTATATNSANTLTWYAGAFGGNSIGTGATFATPYNATTTTYYVDGESAGTPTTVTNGNGLIMNPVWDYPTPFGDDYTASHDQYLILASELYASGFTPGKFTSIAFNLGVVYPSDPLQEYQVQMANTTETSLNTTGLITTGFTMVLPAATYTPPSTTGWATTPFTTPFVWDGVSNVVVDVSFSNAGPTCAYNNNWNGNGQVYQTATSFESAHSYYDNANCTVNTMNPQVTWNNYTYFQRPNMQFGFTPICASPRVAVVATVNTSPAISIAKPDVVCNNEIQSIVASTTPSTNYTNYSWSANPVDLYSDAAATTPYTNGNASTVYVKSTTTGPHSFYLYSSGATAAACTHADTISVWVQPTNVTIDGAPDTVCVSGTTILTLNPSTGYAPNSIQWEESADGVTYNGVTGATSATYTTPTLTNEHYYRAYVKSTHDTCQMPTKHIVVSNPVLTSTADSFACGSGTVTLNAASEGNSAIKWYPTPVGGDVLATGGTFVTPYLGATQTYYVAAEGGYSVPVEYQSGFDNSTTGGSGWNVGPFSVIDQSTVLQYLYTAADIAASGGTAGVITSLAFNCTDAPGSSIPNFKIQMKTVPSTMTSLVWQTNMTNVYTNPSLSVTNTGWVTFQLQQGITWNGTDNIVVQVCRDPVPVTSMSGDHEYTYNSDRMLYGYVYSGLSSCGSTGSNTGGEVPNAKFGIRTVCSSPRVAVNAYVRPKPIVDLGPDKNVCVDSGLSLILDAGVQPNSPQYLWKTGSTSQIAAVNQDGQYWVQVTNEYTCVGSDTVNVILRTNPVANLGNDTTVCNGAVLPLDPGPGGIQYFWNTGQTGEVIDVSSPGTYSVFMTNEAGCSDADTIVVNMQGQLPTIQGIQITNNAQYTFHFEAVNAMNVIGYDWDFGDLKPHSYAASPTHQYDTQGNYTVVLRLSSTCGFVQDSTSAHIVGIHQINVSNDELSVFPNPTTSTATIVIKGSDLQMQKIEVYNVLGQVVYRKDADSKLKHTLSLGALTSGIYTIQVYTDKGTVSRKLEVLK